MRCRSTIVSGLVAVAMIECLRCGRKLTTAEEINSHDCDQRRANLLSRESAPPITVTTCTICGKNTVVRGFCQNLLCSSSTRRTP